MEPPKPKPPPEWQWPRDGEQLEVEVEGHDGVNHWVPAVVLQVLVDGMFQARVQVPDDPFDDWFTWEDEGQDWRRRCKAPPVMQTPGEQPAAAEPMSCHTLQPDSAVHTAQPLTEHPKSAAKRKPAVRAAANIQLPNTENLCGLKEKWRQHRPPSAHMQEDAAQSSVGGEEGCNQAARVVKRQKVVAKSSRKSSKQSLKHEVQTQQLDQPLQPNSPAAAQPTLNTKPDLDECAMVLEDSGVGGCSAERQKSAAKRKPAVRAAADIQLPNAENLCGLKEKWRQRRPPSAHIQEEDAAQSSGKKECTQRVTGQPLGVTPSDGVIDLSKYKSSKSKTGYTGVYLKPNGRYEAQCGRVSCGTYSTLEEAAMAVARRHEFGVGLPKSAPKPHIKPSKASKSSKNSKAGKSCAASWELCLGAYNGEQVSCNGKVGTLRATKEGVTVIVTKEGKSSEMDPKMFEKFTGSAAKYPKKSIRLVSSGVPLGDLSENTYTSGLYGEDTECAMCITKRPLASGRSTDDGLALEVMGHLDRVLREKQGEEGWQKYLDDLSARCIQAERWEIFLDAMDKPTNAFDEQLAPGIESLMQLPTGDAKRLLLEYIKRRAMMDPRVKDDKSCWKFNNFSLIVTYTPVAPQAPHIDLLRPSFQGGLIITAGAPATHFCGNQAAIATITDHTTLAESWSDSKVGEPPAAVVQAVKEHPALRKLLQEFGHVLTCEKQMRQETQPPVQTGLTTGDLLTLPGSVVHAGPKCTKFRAVIFFSASPEDVAEYNPDTQYTGVHLLAHLVSCIWQHHGIGFAERKFLLETLANRIDDCDVRGLYNNFEEGNMSQFLAAIENKVGDRASLIAQKADEEEFCPADGFERASVDGLLVPYTDKKDYECIIYHLDRSEGQEGQVMLHYIESNETEGDRRGDRPYTLRMHESCAPNTLFDGTNGALLDPDGEQIKCKRIHATE